MVFGNEIAVDGAGIGYVLTGGLGDVCRQLHSFLRRVLHSSPITWCCILNSKEDSQVEVGMAAAPQISLASSSSSSRVKEVGAFPMQALVRTVHQLSHLLIHSCKVEGMGPQGWEKEKV